MKKSFVTGRGSLTKTVAAAMVGAAIGEAFEERYPNYMSVKNYPMAKKASQESWYHKTFRKPQRSRYTRTKRGRK